MVSKGVLVAGYGNSTAIGANTHITASNQIRFGDDKITSIGGKVSWSKLSDKRYKYAIKEDIPGLDFINELRAVSYYVDHKKWMKSLGLPTCSDSSNSLIRETGFLAQDVAASAEAMGYEFSGIDYPSSDEDNFALRYAEFTVPLVKAVQELSAENKALKAKIERLENQALQLEALQKEVATIQQLLNQQAQK